MNARTAVQPEPVLRLASLLWRRRRATVIETDLLRIQSELLRQQTPAKTTSVPISPRIVDNAMQPFLAPRAEASVEKNGCSTRQAPIHLPRQLTVSFQRLADLDGAFFERLDRYEARLMRQVFRTINLLRSTGCRP